MVVHPFFLIFFFFYVNLYINLNLFISFLIFFVKTLVSHASACTLSKCINIIINIKNFPIIKKRSISYVLIYERINRFLFLGVHFVLIILIIY